MHTTFDRRALATQLSVALQGLLDVAGVRDDIPHIDAIRFEEARDAAGEVLTVLAATNDPTIEHLLGLAGALRGLAERCSTCVTGMDAQQATAVALAAFDRTSLPLYGHFETGIMVAEEEFLAVGLTTADEETYNATGHKGDLLAYLPCEGVVAQELVHRITRGAEPEQDAQKVGCALRASKALIQALLAGEHRSEADLHDTLANFDGLVV